MFDGHDESREMSPRARRLVIGITLAVVVLAVVLGLAGCGKFQNGDRVMGWVERIPGTLCELVVDPDGSRSYRVRIIKCEEPAAAVEPGR